MEPQEGLPLVAQFPRLNAELEPMNETCRGDREGQWHDLSRYTRVWPRAERPQGARVGLFVQEAIPPELKWLRKEFGQEVGDRMGEKHEPSALDAVAGESELLGRGHGKDREEWEASQGLIDGASQTAHLHQSRRGDLVGCEKLGHFASDERRQFSVAVYRKEQKLEHRRRRVLAKRERQEHRAAQNVMRMGHL